MGVPGHADGGNIGTDVPRIPFLYSEQPDKKMAVISFLTREFTGKNLNTETAARSKGYANKLS